MKQLEKLDRWDYLVLAWLALCPFLALTLGVLVGGWMMIKEG